MTNKLQLNDTLWFTHQFGQDSWIIDEEGRYVFTVVTEDDEGRCLSPEVVACAANLAALSPDMARLLWQIGGVLWVHQFAGDLEDPKFRQLNELRKLLDVLLEDLGEIVEFVPDKEDP